MGLLRYAAVFGAVLVAGGCSPPEQGVPVGAASYPAPQALSDGQMGANGAREFTRADTSGVATGVYPPAAEAAGIEGSATVDCQVDVNGDLTRCLVVNEAPTGYGFARATAATAIQNVHVDLQKKPAGSWVRQTFRFQLEARTTSARTN